MSAEYPEPWRVYRFMAPRLPSRKFYTQFGLPGQNSYLPSRAPRAEISALWAWAYLHHELAEWRVSGTRKEARYWVARTQRFFRWRHPYGPGSRVLGDVMYDGISLLGTLHRDLRLRAWRKGTEAKGWVKWLWGAVKELFGGAHMPGDWGKIVEEWLEQRGLARTGEGWLRRVKCMHELGLPG